MMQSVQQNLSLPMHTISMQLRMDPPTTVSRAAITPMSPAITSIEGNVRDDYTHTL